MEDLFWLRLQVVRAWCHGEARQRAPGTNRSFRFATVTTAFLEVMKTGGRGGAPPSKNAASLGRAAWHAAVLTSLLHVRGVLSAFLIDHLGFQATITMMRCLLY